MSEGLSKTAQKKLELSNKALGNRLLTLSDDELDQLSLPEPVRSVIAAAQTMSARGALRRQRQLLAKHLRVLDTRAIEAEIRALTADDRQRKALFKRAEGWRDRVVRHGEPALRELLDASTARYAELAPLVRELERGASDVRGRELKRRLFRLIHAELAEKLPSKI